MDRILTKHREKRPHGGAGSLEDAGAQISLVYLLLPQGHCRLQVAVVVDAQLLVVTKGGVPESHLRVDGLIVPKFAAELLRMTSRLFVVGRVTLGYRASLQSRYASRRRPPRQRPDVTANLSTPTVPLSCSNPIRLRAHARHRLPSPIDSGLYSFSGRRAPRLRHQGSSTTSQVRALFKSRTLIAFALDPGFVYNLAG